MWVTKICFKFLLTMKLVSFCNERADDEGAIGGKYCPEIVCVFVCGSV